MFKGILALLGALAVATPLPAATLLVSGGKLVGARNVDVAGSLYDVSFLEGSCVEVFSGCDDPSDFAFQQAQPAFEATLSLIRQVLIDGPEGQFDSNYASTFGCEENPNKLCSIRTPYFFGFEGFYAAQVAGNTNAVQDFVASGDDFVGAASSLSTFSTRDDAWAVWAKFELSAVPEPSSWVMMISGFGLVGLVRRRRNWSPASA